MLQNEQAGGASAGARASSRSTNDPDAVPAQGGALRGIALGRRNWTFAAASVAPNVLRCRTPMAGSSNYASGKRVMIRTSTRARAGAPLGQVGGRPAHPLRPSRSCIIRQATFNYAWGKKQRAPEYCVGIHRNRLTTQAAECRQVRAVQYAVSRLANNAPNSPASSSTNRDRCSRISPTRRDRRGYSRGIDGSR